MTNMPSTVSLPVVHESCSQAPDIGLGVVHFCTSLFLANCRSTSAVSQFETGGVVKIFLVVCLLF